jgi:hypothetical protein
MQWETTRLLELTHSDYRLQNSPVPSVARPTSFSAPRSLSVNAIVKRKSQLSMKSAVNANVAATASNRSRATKVRTSTGGLHSRSLVSSTLTVNHAHTHV